MGLSIDRPLFCSLTIIITMTNLNNIVPFTVSNSARRISALFAELQLTGSTGQVEFFKCNGIYWITMDYGDTHTGFDAGLSVVSQCVVEGGFFTETIYKVNGDTYSGDYFSFEEFVQNHSEINGYSIG